MAQPAGDRLLDGVEVPGGHVGDGRSARSPVQVLVGAPHREVDAGVVEVQVHRPDGVRHVPEGQRAGVVGRSGERGQIVSATRAVVDVGEGDHSRGVVDRVDDLVRSDGEHVGVERVEHVAVRREAAGLGDDPQAARAQPERRRRQLEPEDRGAVGNDDLSARSAQQRSDALARRSRAGPTSRRSSRRSARAPTRPRDRAARRRCPASADRVSCRRGRSVETRSRARDRRLAVRDRRRW